MSVGASQGNGKGALEILEEAAHLLRLTPAQAFLCYYVGTLPFVLGFLFFCADMSCSGTAGNHLTEASLGLAALFVWMKCWQAVFAFRLQEALGDARSSRDIYHIVRLVLIQSAAMPWSLLVLPLALIIILPFGWCYAFFNNFTTVGSGEKDLRGSVLNAWRQSILWPAQNLKLILILLVFTLFAFLNICMTAYLIPAMMRSLLGIETIFSRSNLSILNTTFLLSMAGITYLCVNPLTRAAYVLRCYYGESLCSGHDLLTELKRLRGVALKALVLLIAIPSFWLLFPDRVNAAPGPTEVQSVSSVDSHGVSAEKLDKAIAGVMGRLEYSWRFPHNKAEEQKQAGFLGQAVDAIGRWLKEAWDRLIDLIELLSDWMDKILPKQQSEASSGSSIFYDRRLWIIICFVCVAAFFIWLLLRKSPAELDTPAEAPSARVEPDLANENISADELSSARWLDLAGRLREQGELRMALRAFYFATLAGLAEKELLTIARFKSNRDYDREIKRRAHFSPRQISAFSENITILERIWYGMHAVQPEMLDRFLGNYKWITVDERKQ